MKALILEDSTYAVPVANRRVRGNSLHIEEAFIDALYLTRRKLRTLFYNQSVKSQKTKLAITPTGMTFIIPSYIVHGTLYISWVCHIGVGFIVVY